MPQAFSVSTSLGVAPAAPAAPSSVSATPARGTPLSPAQDNDNPGPTDFLGQLKTALKHLTKAVKQPTVVAESVPQIAAAAHAPATDTSAAPADAKDAAPVDHTADALPDVLAALGFVPVPIAFAPPPAPALTAAAAPAATAAPEQLPAALPQAAPIDLPQPAAAAPESQTPLDVSKLPQSEAPLPTPELQTAQPLTTPAHLATRARTAQVKSSPSTPSSAPSGPPAPSTPADAPTQALGPAVVAPQGSPAQQHAAAPTTRSADVPPQSGAAAQPSGHRGATQQGHADDDGQPTSPQTIRIEDTQTSPAVIAAAPDATIAAAAGSTVANSPIVLPPYVRPAEVVSQIAHQADLYRLPGNRGVRVQLHPEDLGGVEVTLRYGAGGALQLHINVEHAATGALVQAGWAELRDALATQGISPERLVMSVTTPTSSSQLDFSGGGSGRQTDPGMAGFAQSQSGQQRQDNSEQTGPRSWNGAVEPTSPSDDNPRVASPSAATSRIDYRA